MSRRPKSRFLIRKTLLRLRHRTLPWLSLVLGSATASGAAAQNPPAPNANANANAYVVTAVPLGADEKVSLDGRLDEPVWSRAQPAKDFVQVDPANGAPATERTEVRIAFDRERLYLGVICYDSDPAGIRGKQMLRDAD